MMAKLRKIRLADHNPRKPVKGKCVAGTKYNVTLYATPADMADLLWNHGVFEGKYDIRAVVVDSNAKKTVGKWNAIPEDDRNKVINWIIGKCAECEYTLLENPVKVEEQAGDAIDVADYINATCPVEDDESEHAKPIDKKAELDDIKDYFLNRSEGQHASGKAEDKPRANEFYFVNTSYWCMRDNARNEGTVSAHGTPSYSNVFDSYEKALDYAHLMMMVSRGVQIHNWDKFKDSIEIVEAGETPSGVCGYVHHPMKDGIERFEGFDRSGNYPCLFDDITITKRTVYAVRHERKSRSKKTVEKEAVMTPVQVQNIFTMKKPDEFTEEQHEDNQKAIERITNEIGGVESLFEGDERKQREFDRMKDLLGWGDEEQK